MSNAKTYEQIKGLHEAGKTTAEIAAEKTAEGVTVKDIDLGDLLYLLNFRDMLTKEVGNDSAKKWAGSILDMQAAIAADPVATLSVKQWLSHITNTRNTDWQTSRPEYAAPFYALYVALNNSSIFNAGDMDAIYELGGGRVEWTADEVQALIDAEAKRSTTETLDAEWTALLNDGGINAAVAAGDRIGLVSALRAAADAIEG